MQDLSRRVLLTAAGSVAFVGRARAQTTRPISLLVGFSAGGSADLVARVMAAELGPRLKRTVVVENVPGASGMLPLQRLVSNRPDINTIYFGGFDTVAVPMVNRNMKIDWKRDTIPVGRTTIGSMVFAVPAASPHRDMAGFLGAARRAGPEKISYGTPGVATAQHLLGELIGTLAGAKLLHSPYRGGNLVVNDLLAGNLDSAILVTSTALPPIQQGGLRALAVSSASRLPQLPDVPALSELPGFAGVSFPLWQGIFVRSGTPDSFVRELEAAIGDALASSQTQRQLAEAGFDAAPLGGDAFTAFIQEQADRYQEIVAGAKVTLE